MRRWLGRVSVGATSTRAGDSRPRQSAPTRTNGADASPVKLVLSTTLWELARRSTVPITPGELPSARLVDIAEATAYYLVATALTNAQKHARTSMRVHAAITSGTLRLESSTTASAGQ